MTYCITVGLTNNNDLLHNSIGLTNNNDLLHNSRPN